MAGTIVLSVSSLAELPKNGMDFKKVETGSTDYLYYLVPT